MTNAPFTEIGHYADLESVNYHADALSLGMQEAAVLQSLSVKIRDHARTPVQWDDSPTAGFTTGRPWLPVNPNSATINAAAAVADPESVFHHYRRLVELRHQHRVVVDGTFALLLPDDEQVFAYTRTRAPESLLVLANFSSTPVEVAAAALPDLRGAEVLLATHPDTDPNALELLPWESRVYRLS
jgi:oligo-1,6-glucosidase